MSEVIAYCETCKFQFKLFGINAKSFEEGKLIDCPNPRCSGKIRKLETNKK